MNPKSISKILISGIQECPGKIRRTIRIILRLNMCVLMCSPYCVCKVNSRRGSAFRVSQAVSDIEDFITPGSCFFHIFQERGGRGFMLFCII